MNLKEAKERRDVLVARTLEIEAELAQMKLAWYANAEKPDAHITRATLEAERAKLAIEKNALSKQINAGNKAEREYLDTMTHAVLVRMLYERGMSDLVLEARRIASEQRISVG